MTPLIYCLIKYRAQNLQIRNAYVALDGNPLAFSVNLPIHRVSSNLPIWMIVRSDLSAAVNSWTVKASSGRPDWSASCISD